MSRCLAVPGWMVINTESMVGYNNQLKQAGAGMKLGINNEVNTSTKKAALQHMAGGKSNINPPNSHSSNLIHNAATSKKRPAVQTAAEPTPAVQTQLEPRPPAGSCSETHENNKIALAVGAVAIAGLLFLALR